MGGSGVVQVIQGLTICGCNSGIAEVVPAGWIGVGKHRYGVFRIIFGLIATKIGSKWGHCRICSKSYASAPGDRQGVKSESL